MTEKNLHVIFRFRPGFPKGELVFHLNQHIGKPAKPLVQKGDSVLAGQIIAEADGFVSANIISSVSRNRKSNRETGKCAWYDRSFHCS